MLDFIRGFLREIPKPSVLLCGSSPPLADQGWDLLLAETGLLGVGWGSLFSCPVSSLLLWPQKPFWASSLPSPACSGSKWPGLIFLPPLVWSQECFWSSFRHRRV